jgi:hypothetical protein
MRTNISDKPAARPLTMEKETAGDLKYFTYLTKWTA